MTSARDREMAMLVIKDVIASPKFDMDWTDFRLRIAATLAQARSEEREACAKVAAALVACSAGTIAAAIRARAKGEA